MGHCFEVAGWVGGGYPVLLIEQLAVNARAAATVQLVDGWLLRPTPGVARRRCNSALPPPSAARASGTRREQVLDLAERLYARRGQPAVVQVSPAGHGSHRLYLQVEEDNLAALRLYRRLGFRPSHHYHHRVAA